MKESAALGDGRKDAVFFVIGGLVGAFIYILIYGRLSSTWVLEKILGGDSTLALTPGTGYPAIIDSIPGVAVALVIAIVFAVIAWMLPKSPG